MAREPKIVHICCLCNKKSKGMGNNAEPLESGTCCDDCNISAVIPARIDLLKRMEEIWLGGEKIRKKLR